jgi:hypothetical protein
VLQSQAKDFTYNGLTYTTLTDNTCETKQGGWYNAGNSVSGDIVIPKTVYDDDGNVYTVTQIGYRAFSECSELTSVEIPNSVTSIGGYAFNGCSGLTSVIIPSSVTTMGYYVFDGCSNLNSLTFEDGEKILTIGDSDANDLWSTPTIESLYLGRNISFTCDQYGPFDSNSNLKSVVIGETVNKIYDYCFYKCTGLTSVIIPNLVTSIGERAFSGCASLTSLTIPDLVTSIGNYAFNGCRGLTSVTIPNSVTSIGKSAFNYCTGVTELNIADSNTELTIGDGAFRNVKPTKVYLGRNISSAVFTEDTNLSEIIIGEKVTYISNSEFSGCTGLQWIESKATTPPTITEDTFSDYKVPLIAASKDYKTADYWKNFTNVSTEYTPTGRTFEENGLKYEIIDVNDCTCRLYGIDESVEGNVVIPSTVTYREREFTPIEISGVLIKGETPITSLSIPSNISTLTSGCVLDASLAKLTVNTAITNNITVRASIDELVIAPSATEFSNDLNSNTIAKLTIEDGETSLTTTQFKGVIKELYLGRNVSENTFAGLTSLEKVSISDKATSIEQSTFSGCSSMSELNIAESETELTIGSSAFSNVKPTKVYLGRNISSAIFTGDTNLSDLTIGDKVTAINNSEFNGCTSLSELRLPNSVTSIGSSAFNDCSAHTALTIPSSVTSIGSSAFNGCSTLTALTIPNSVTTIGNDAFGGCTGIAELKFEDGERKLTLGDDAFKDVTLKEIYFGRQMNFANAPVSALETVEFGENVTSIETGAFKDAQSLISVTSRNTVPPTTENPFNDDTYLDGTLYVLATAIETYKAAAGWKNFWTVKAIDGISSGVSEIGDNSNALFSVENGVIRVSGDADVRVVSMNGTIIYSGRGETGINVTPGVYIVIINNTPTKVAVK